MPWSQGKICGNSQMKRLFSIVCCLLLFFGSVAAALAVCKRVSFTSNNDHHASTANEHHSDSSHEHPDEATIHCLTIAPFIPTVMFSARPDRGSVRFVSSISAELAFCSSDGEFHRFTHVPPAIPRASGVPAHLFNSVLRI
jgi:hypothetical protein